MDRVWPDHVQLRLRMTSEQINERRQELINGKREDKAEAAYKAEHERVWSERLRTPTARTEGHWKYYASLARDVANGKGSRASRNFWKKRARVYEANARDRSETT